MLLSRLFSNFSIFGKILKLLENFGTFENYEVINKKIYIFVTIVF